MAEATPRGQVWQLGRVVDWLHDKLVEPYLNEHDTFLQRLRKIMTIVTSHVVPGLVVVSLYLFFISLTYGPPEHWSGRASNRSGNETASAGSRSFEDSYFATSVAWAVMVVIFPLVTLTCNLIALLMFYCGAKRDGAATKQRYPEVTTLQLVMLFGSPLVPLILAAQLAPLYPSNIATMALAVLCTYAFPPNEQPAARSQQWSSWTWRAFVGPVLVVCYAFNAALQHFSITDVYVALADFGHQACTNGTRAGNSTCISDAGVFLANRFPRVYIDSVPFRWAYVGVSCIFVTVPVFCTAFVTATFHYARRKQAAVVAVTRDLSNAARNLDVGALQRNLQRFRDEFAVLPFAEDAVAIAHLQSLVDETTQLERFATPDVIASLHADDQNDDPAEVGLEARDDVVVLVCDITGWKQLLDAQQQQQQHARDARREGRRQKQREASEDGGSVLDDREAADEEALEQLLCDIAAKVHETVRKYQGLLISVDGMRFVAAWGAVSRVRALHRGALACCAALEIADAFRTDFAPTACRMWGIAQLRAKMGLHRGRALVGNIGTSSLDDEGLPPTASVGEYWARAAGAAAAQNAAPALRRLAARPPPPRDEKSSAFYPRALFSVLGEALRVAVVIGALGSNRVRSSIALTREVLVGVEESEMAWYCALQVNMAVRELCVFSEENDSNRRVYVGLQLVGLAAPVFPAASGLSVPDAPMVAKTTCQQRADELGLPGASGSLPQSSDGADAAASFIPSLQPDWTRQMREQLRTSASASTSTSSSSDDDSDASSVSPTHTPRGMAGSSDGSSESDGEGGVATAESSHSTEQLLENAGLWRGHKRILPWEDADDDHADTSSRPGLLQSEQSEAEPKSPLIDAPVERLRRAMNERHAHLVQQFAASPLGARLLLDEEAVAALNMLTTLQQLFCLATRPGRDSKGALREGVRIARVTSARARALNSVAVATDGRRPRETAAAIAAADIDPHTASVTVYSLAPRASHASRAVLADSSIDVRILDLYQKRCSVLRKQLRTGAGVGASPVISLAYEALSDLA